LVPHALPRGASATAAISTAQARAKGRGVI
jgi:hypothetical protein